MKDWLQMFSYTALYLPFKVSIYIEILMKMTRSKHIFMIVALKDMGQSVGHHLEG